MDYNSLLDLVCEIGARLTASGAETFRVEESVTRILAAYGLQAEVFAIPNSLIVSIETEDREPLTRLRRIQYHGFDLDQVERYNGLSRRICAKKPEPKVALEWLEDTAQACTRYSFPMQIFGGLIGAAGYAVFFGGNLRDFLCAGICGSMVALINRFLSKRNVNSFFSTIASAFLVALLAYGLTTLGLSQNANAVIIGTLMMLVPGLPFTNALRDIIFGDTNSGMNRIIQVLLSAVAIALGTGAALSAAGTLWGGCISAPNLVHPLWFSCLFAALGCIGFCIFFNIHGKGTIMCVLGGGLTWAVCGISMALGVNVGIANFLATLFAATYSEVMARIRKYPALSYQLISIFPLFPGAGVYYTTLALIDRDMGQFSQKGGETIAIAGAIAVGILIVSTLFRLLSDWKRHKK